MTGIVIDTNSMHTIFKEDSSTKSTQAVKTWLDSPQGSISIGGSQYMDELVKSGYLKLLNEYNKLNKIRKLDNKQVDTKQQNVSKQEKSADFDDQHLVALLIVSKSSAICSEDKRAYKFFRSSKWFTGSTRPAILHSKTRLKDCKNVLAKIKA